VESRENKRPILSDLRESGSIEQDADLVLFVYREEYYVNFQKPTEPGPDTSEVDPVNIAFQEWQRQMAKVFGIAEVVVAKSRHGSTGTVPVKFDAKITRFSDLADSSYQVPDYE
jgi:replicative DNA helicase